MERHVGDFIFRYTQEYAYTMFSQGQMTVAETLFALVYGLMDPKCLAPIRVFLCEDKFWCIDTRRLMLIRELIRREEWTILNAFPIVYITRKDMAYASQFRELEDHRLPSMKRRNLDGLSIKVSYKYGSKCCYDQEKNRFRTDLDQHIVDEHLKLPMEWVKSLKQDRCENCQEKTNIWLQRGGKKRKSHLKIERQCGCEVNPAFYLDNPWCDNSLLDICLGLFMYKIPRILNIADSDTNSESELD